MDKYKLIKESYMGIGKKRLIIIDGMPGSGKTTCVP
jgi:HrpA-like RNA helicase